jgi:hypothetical protein
MCATFFGGAFETFLKARFKTYINERGAANFRCALFSSLGGKLHNDKSLTKAGHHARPWNGESHTGVVPWMDG